MVQRHSARRLLELCSPYIGHNLWPGCRVQLRSSKAAVLAATSELVPIPRKELKGMLPSFASGPWETSDDVQPLVYPPFQNKMLRCHLLSRAIFPLRTPLGTLGVGSFTLVPQLLSRQIIYTGHMLHPVFITLRCHSFLPPPFCFINFFVQ
jgi:hypothetical protein